jgi:murein DD-endopeptidase MepM/ murein hydrolase activator NlpD
VSVASGGGDRLKSAARSADTQKRSPVSGAFKIVSLAHRPLPIAFAWIAVLILAGVPRSSTTAQAQRDGAANLAVSHRGGPLHPGDVTLVVATAPQPLAELTGTVFGRRITFWEATGAPGEWQALVAVALDTKPGSYTLEVRAMRPGGQQSSATAVLTVQPKQFETRKLSVSSRFVDPPASESARIEREAKRLASLFVGSSPRLWRGSFAAPVPGRATSSFGRLSVFNGQPRGRHQGADFTAAVGTPVRAPNTGRVVLAEDLYFSGNTVVLDHGAGLFSLFAHLSRIGVEPGSTAGRSDVLGEAGATGRVTGPHLHWAVRLGEVSVDPLSLMSAAAGLSEGPELPSAR